MITVLVGVKKRAQALSAQEVNRPLMRVSFLAGLTMSRTEPFQNGPSSSLMVARPVAQQMNRPVAR